MRLGARLLLSSIAGEAARATSPISLTIASVALACTADREAAKTPLRDPRRSK